MNFKEHRAYNIYHGLCPFKYRLVSEDMTSLTFSFLDDFLGAVSNTENPSRSILKRYFQQQIHLLN